MPKTRLLNALSGHIYPQEAPYNSACFAHLILAVLCLFVTFPGLCPIALTQDLLRIHCLCACSLSGIWLVEGLVKRAISCL
jgi:hypothetical protein